MSLKSFIAGGGGGASLVLVGQPFDTIKVRIQGDTQGIYKGVVDCATQTIRKEGPLALYKGMLPPLCASTPMYALCFMGYNQGKKIFCDEDAFDPDNLKLTQIGLAGATSAIFTTPIQAPQELLKCTLQLQKDATFKGPMDVFRHLHATGGVRALTRGFGVTLVRDSSASVMYFSWYELMKAQLSHVPGLSNDGARPPPCTPRAATATATTEAPAGYRLAGTINFGGILVAGGVAGIWNWVPAIPFDVLKTKYQTNAKYSGAIFGANSVRAEVLATEGIKGMFRGTAPIFIRAVPANAACFCGYEVCVSLLDKTPLKDY